MVSDAAAEVQVKLIQNPPPWPADMPSLPRTQKQAEAHSAAVPDSPDHEQHTPSGQLEQYASSALLQPDPPKSQPTHTPPTPGSPEPGTECPEEQSESNLHELYGSGSVSQAASRSAQSPGLRPAAAGAGGSPVNLAKRGSAAKQKDVGETLSFIESSDSESPLHRTGSGSPTARAAMSPRACQVISFNW